MKATLTPRELANAIGVSESSLKRWADEGLVRVSRTAGGHRRIPIAEAVRFIRETRSPVIHPEILGMNEVAVASSQRTGGLSPAAQLHSHLAEGRAAEARGLLMSLYLSGMSIAAIGDGPLHAAMSRIGEAWTRDTRGVFVEHRAADICLGAMTQLHAMIGVPDGAPVAVGGAAPHDPGVLASTVAATVLASEGMRTVNLGAFTPLATLRHAVEEHQAVIAWLSVTHLGDAPELKQGIAGLAREVARRNCILAIGGHQHAALGLSSGGNLFVGASMSDLATLARGVVAAAAAGATTAAGATRL